jgi:hypothetical protein
VALRLIGYWRDEQHGDYPDPHDMVDQSWDDDQRLTVATYFRGGTFLRGFMGLSPCRLCGKPNGASEYTDGVLVWPEGLAHYVEDHSVRLPEAIEQYVLRRVDRVEATSPSLEWWLGGATKGPEPLEPLERLVWGGNVQLAKQPGRRFPGLFLEGDTLASHVDGPTSAELLAWYEDMMTAAGLDELPYPSVASGGRPANVGPSSVDTRDRFAAFLQDLLGEYRSGGGRTEWENGTLERFLDALAALADSRVVGRADQEVPSWQLFAEIIAAATGYA